MWSDDPEASKKPNVTNLYPEICASHHASSSHAVTFSIRLTAVAVQEPFTPARLTPLESATCRMHYRILGGPLSVSTLFGIMSAEVKTKNFSLGKRATS